MTAIDAIERVLNTTLVNEDFRYCLVNSCKIPFTINNKAMRINKYDEFVSLSKLLENNRLDSYSGIGISVQASKVCAIDIDNCVTKPFSLKHINSFGQEIIDMFKNIAYVEFSFSGTGIRILLKQESIKDYSRKYRIKNSNIGLEYYQYDMNARYVTVTGHYIYNNSISVAEDNRSVLIKLLDKYMLKPKRQRFRSLEESEDTREISEILKSVKIHLFKDYNFQDLWYSHAPGSGKDESERDFFLLRYIYNNITQDRSKAKQIFEMSEFYKTKDDYHLYKWSRNNHWYYNHIFNNIKRGL